MGKNILAIVVLITLVGCKSATTNDALFTDEGTMTVFPYSKNGVKVTKMETITEIPEFPGLKVIETAYINLGNPITVRAYEMNRISMKANDSVVWSLQPSSSAERLDWVLPVMQGFHKDNYLGMNNCDYGGGIPVLDLWQRDGGVAVGLIDTVLRSISMPVDWQKFTNTVTACLRYDYPEPITLQKGDTLHTFTHFVYEHQGDYFNALRTFSDYMQSINAVTMRPSEPEAFEPVWCAWGYERQFTIDEVVGTLDKVQELGFTWVDIDDGYQIAEGDWETNSRFPGGDADMRRLTDEVHKRGMKAKLWWAPLAADPGTKVLQQHPEMKLLTKEYAPEYITWWDSYYLSPVNPATREYTKGLVHRFIDTWGFDGLKIDGQHLNCCMPDYNEASELTYPEQAPEQMPSFFGFIYDEAHAIKKNAVIQVCPCGCAVNYYLVPQINQAVASDPTSSRQVRMKRKAYAAMAPRLAYYGDHVELTDGGCDFASQIGTGSVIGTKFTYPADNPTASASFLLTQEKEQLIRHWIGIYRAKNLACGEYLNLYTWGFDYPEAHVIRQNDKLYYAFYADSFDGELELRGLEPGREYTVTEYTLDTPRVFTIFGGEAIHKQFNMNYLIEVE